MKTKKKRFSVSLPEPEYEKLVRLAEEHRPQLTFNYVVSWALQQVLDRVDDPELSSELANPLKKGKRK